MIKRGPVVKFLFSFLLAQNAFAETTDSDMMNTGPEEGETYYAGSAPMTCTLRAERGYRIRQGPTTSQPTCNSFRRGSDSVATVVGQDGNWIKFTSEETRSCPGGVGYAFYLAFNDQDFQRYKNGECGRSALDGGRTPVQPAPTESSVNSTNSRGHTFPLDTCHGIKNDGGLGHYGAPRRRGARRYSHTGTDYYAPCGTPARSPCEGKVTSSNYGDVVGNTVVITCNNGDVFKFMHMHARPPKVRQGTTVTSGSTIGGVGNTGNARSQACHLHTEAIINGRRTDPQSLWACGGDSGH